MSVAYVLNSDESTIKIGINTELNIKGPKHIISDIELTKNQNGSLNIPANIETTQINAPVGVIDSINTELLIPKGGIGQNISVDGSLTLGDNNTPIYYNLTSGQINVKDNEATTTIILDTNGTVICGALQSNISGQVNLYDVGIIQPKFGQAPEAGYVLKAANNNGIIEWSSPSTQTIAEILATDDDANQNNLINLNTLKANNISSNTNSDLGIAAGSENNKIVVGNEIDMSNKNIDDVNSLYASTIGVDTLTTKTGSGSLLVSSGVQILSNDLTVDNSTRLNGSVEFNYNTVTNDYQAYMNNGELYCQKLNPVYKPERTLWVSPNGNNNNSGSFESPLQSVQLAINHAESQYDGNYWFINVQAGVYVEDITISKKLYITGQAPSSPDANSTGCEIRGNITISVNADDGNMTNNIVCLSNLFISSGSIDCNSGNTARSILNLTDVYMYNDSGNGRMIHYNPAASDGRLWLNNCQFINSSPTATEPLIEINLGMIKMNQCQLQASGNENVLLIAGTARVDTIVLSKFTSTTNSQSALPIVEISSSGTTYTFGNCAFIYSNSANKGASSVSSGVYMSGSTPSRTLIAQYCAFSLLGTSATTNYAIQDANAGGANQAIFITYGNNSVINTAFQVRGTQNLNKFSNITSDSLTVPRLDVSTIGVNNNTGSANQILGKDSNNNLAWITGGAGGGESLAQTLAIGNKASTLIDMSNNDITAIKDLYLNNATSNLYVNGNAGTANQVLGKTSQNQLTWINQSGGGSSAFTGYRSVYVDSTNTNPSPDGSISNPFTSVVNALAFTQANFSTSLYWVIYIYSGTYTGDLTISKPRIFFQGIVDNNSQTLNTDGPVKITGNITIATNTSALSASTSIISFENICIKNSTITDIASSDPYSLVFNNCLLTRDTTNVAPRIINSISSTASRIYFFNTRVSFTAISVNPIAPIIFKSNPGQINARESTFVTDTNLNILELEGTAYIELCQNCVFTNTVESSNVTAPIYNKGSSSIFQVFLNNVFRYTSTVGKGANATAIFQGNTVANAFPRIMLVGNYFDLQGTSNGSNFVVRDTQTSTSTFRSLIYYGGNFSAPGSVSNIQGTINENKFPLASVS